MALCPYCEQTIPDVVVRDMAEELGMVEPDGYHCGAELDSGGICSREVDAADARCWQHA